MTWEISFGMGEDAQSQIAWGFGYSREELIKKIKVCRSESERLEKALRDKLNDLTMLDKIRRDAISTWEWDH